MSGGTRIRLFRMGFEKKSVLIYDFDMRKMAYMEGY